MKRFINASIGPLVIVLMFIAARMLFPNKMTFIIEIAIFSIYVMGNNILYGYLGMVSFGQPFYLGVGAYATAIYLAHVGTNPLIGLAVALIAGLVIGLILGPAFVRLRGDYFALINAAISAIGLFTIETLLLPITRGDDGLWYRSRMSEIPFLDIRIPDKFFIFALSIFLIVLILYNFMDGSLLGKSFRAIKDKESKMRFLGYDTHKIKVIGFTLASILSALSGALYAINFGFVNPSLAETHRAVEVLVATLIGGAGTVFGPLFGTLAFLGIKDLVSNYIAHWELVVGILTMFVLFRFSKGIWGNAEVFIDARFGRSKRLLETLPADKESS
ncbi:MAG: branched-chain amino acid ABC transporter permease [bacterium]